MAPVEHGAASLAYRVGMFALAALVLAAWWRRRGARLAAAPARPSIGAPSDAILLFGLLFVGAWLGAGTASRLGAGAPEGSLAATAIGMLGAAIGQVPALLGYLVLLRRAPVPEPDRRPGLVVAAALGIGFMLLAWPIVQAVGDLSALVARALGRATEPLAHRTLEILRDDPGGPWPVVAMIVVVVAAPIAEEVAYRGLVQETLRRLGRSPWLSIAVASVIFTVMHMPVVVPHALPALFVLSLAFGWAYERTGRLTAPIVMHAAFNAANLALAGLEG